MWILWYVTFETVEVNIDLQSMITAYKVRQNLVQVIHMHFIVS